MLVLPLLVAGVDAWINDTWPLLALLVAFICAEAAFWTSVGLALSTWMARLGRAAAVAVAAYAVVGVGWPVLVGTLFDAPLASGPGGDQPLPRVVSPEFQSRVSEIHRQRFPFGIRAGLPEKR